MTPTAKHYNFRFPDEVFPPHFTRRQAILMGVCGAIGTGMLLRTGQPLVDAGPLGVLLGYAATSSVVYGYIVSVAEMVAAYPGSRGVVGLANRFVDPALGFALGWNAWYNWALMIPTQILCAMALIEHFQPPVWSIYVVSSAFIFLVFTVASGGGRLFANIVSGFAVMKIILVVTLAFVSFFLHTGTTREEYSTPQDGADLGLFYEPRAAVSNWNHPLSQYLGIKGAWGRFLGFWAVFMQAANAFFGVETSLLVAQEVRDAPRVVLHVARRSWLLVTILYLASVAAAGTLVHTEVLRIAIDGNSNLLVPASPWKTSPFLLALPISGSDLLMILIMSGIICSALSAAAVEVFSSVRLLYWMGYERNAPQLLTSLWFHHKGQPTRRAVGKAPVPWLGLVITFLFASLSFMGLRRYGNGKSEEVFDLLNCMAAAMYFQSWVAVLFTYLRFWRGTVKKRAEYPDQIKRIERNRAWGQPFWAIYSFSVAVLVLTFNGWSLFNTKNARWQIYYDPNDDQFPSGQALKFITSYLPIPVIILLIFGYKFIHQSELVHTKEMDFSDVCNPDDPDICPEELKEHPPTGRWARFWWFLAC